MLIIFIIIKQFKLNNSIIDVEEKIKLLINLGDSLV